MRLPRIFINQVFALGEAFLLPKETAHYVRQVLRLRDSAGVIIFNGQGGEYHGFIQWKNKDTLVVPEDFVDTLIESPLPIHLGQGISRGEKMDYVVQKAVELGVFEITPLFTERCGVKLDEERALKRLDHWKKIVISACEQSGRNILPRINAPQYLAEWLLARNEPHRWICQPGLPQSKMAMSPSPMTVLLVGAEGGFTEDEVNAALAHQFQSLALGPRILRTETAAVAALTKLQVTWGDMAGG